MVGFDFYFFRFSFSILKMIIKINNSDYTLADEDEYCYGRDNYSHCWHHKNIQFPLRIGNIEIVICCHCGCDGIGIPTQVTDHNHGKYYPAFNIEYKYARIIDS